MMAAMTNVEAPFDRVVVSDRDGQRQLTPGEFFALPLSSRIRMVLERTVTFYLGRVEIDRNAALEALRRIRVS